MGMRNTGFHRSSPRTLRRRYNTVEQAMKSNKRNHDIFFYGLAFLVALGLRCYQLGAASLSEGEAGWAMQALGLSRGSAVSLGAQPAYLLLTSVLFSVFGSTIFMARILPALAGSLLVWLPFFFRRWMGDSIWLRRAGVVMAFGLALDPGLVSLSRQIGSPMLAVAFTLLALACLYNRYSIWLGIFAGLALLSGPAFIQGLLILGLSWGVFRVVGGLRFPAQSESNDNDQEPADEPIPASSLRVSLVAFLLTVLVAGTLFLHVPQGLGALADTLSAYLKTWVTPSGIPLLRLPASLLVYQLITVIFGFIAGLRAWFGHWEDQRIQRGFAGLSVWAIVALIIPLLYLGRQVGDLAWMLIPLWALAAIEISRAFLPEEDQATRLVAAGLGVLLCVFTVIGWLNLLAIGRFQSNVILYWAIIVGAFLLGLVAVLLVITGWSAHAAKLGVIWALCVVLGLFLFSNTWGSTIVRHNGAQELWSVSPTPGQMDQLMTTLSDLSSWNTGLRDQLEVVALTDSPSVQWELRNFPYARFQSSLSSSEAPPAVITLKESEEPALAQDYRGQDFVWLLSPGWQGVFPPQFINWLAFRQAPLSQEQVILWARSDAFPGGSSNISGNAAP
jgi:hypothetical protein